MTLAGSERDEFELADPLLEVVSAALRGQMRSYVQPVIDLCETSRVVGGESLLRWHHPSRGVLVAADFLHLLDDAKMLVDIDLAAWEQMASDLGRLDPFGHRLARLWLNVSAAELGTARYLDQVLTAAGQAGIHGSRIGIEIPEAVVTADEGAVTERLTAFRQRGVAVAIDHFGLHPSLLHRLGGFPADSVKLDRTLTGRIDGNATTRMFVATVIDLAHAAGLTVVAEGVERTRQVALLRELGCDCAQGYLFGQAVPLDELPTLTDAEPPPCIWWG